MAFILNIDTAIETAIVSISNNEKVIDFASNNNQNDHASFLHPVIKILLKNLNLQIKNLEAIAVTAGPGSYTGLRVGMAAAKGLCYALNIPLITISTLEVMAQTIINKTQDPSSLYCPLIDARRMEVFTAVYDHHLTEVIKTSSVILEEGSFKNLIQTHKIYFSGSGSEKLKQVLDNRNAVFITNNKVAPQAMAQLAYNNFANKTFADISYSTPAYLKEFFTPTKL